MEHNKKISIITVCYNSEKSIKKTIESIIKQNYEPLEYWIIDGGSNDRTVQIIREYASSYPYIKYISERDKGISDAFNKGILLSTGELIGLINSDDLLLENALIAISSKYKETGCDVIFGDTIVNDVENGLFLYKKAGNPSQLKYEMPFIHQSCFIRKDIYTKYGYYSENYKICMDYDMLARIYKGGASFAYVNKPIALFQYGGTSCEHPIKTILEDMEIAQKYGLSAKEARKYKLRNVPRNIAKTVLTTLHIWTPLYRLFNRKDIVKNMF